MNPITVTLPDPTDPEDVGVGKLVDALHAIESALNAVVTEIAASPAVPNQPPTPVIEKVAQSDLSVSFSGAKSTDPEGPIASYTWRFGDGATATGMLASHTYLAAGTYTVTLTVADSDGLSRAATATVTVTVAAPPVTTPGGSEPSGPDIVSYRTLSGANPTARLNTVASGQKVSLPPQVIAWNDFAQAVDPSFPTTSGNGMLMQRPGQILGSGIGATVLRMNTGTTSKRTQVGGTTKLQYVNVLGSTKLVQDLTMQGVPINEGSYTGTTGKQTTTADVTTQNIYNGFFINKVDNFVMRRVKVSAIPGSYQAPPGETFAIDVYRGSNHTYEDIEIDGQNTIATGWGPNFLAGTQIVNRLNAHDCRYSSGAAIYATTGTLVMTDCVFRRNYNAVNFEDCAYDSAKLVRPLFDTSKTSDINWWGDTTTQSISKSFPLDIYDPLGPDGRALTTKIRVKCPPLHGPYTNVMRKSDIRVWVRGVLQNQADVITFLN